MALGKAFLLQGGSFTISDSHENANALPGDCAELFDYCEEEAIESKIKLLLQMSLVLIWGSSSFVAFLHFATGLR